MTIAETILKHIEIIQDLQISDSDISTINHKISLNSIQYIKLIVKLEEEFNIEFPDELLLYESEIRIEELTSVIDELLHG